MDTPARYALLTGFLLALGCGSHDNCPGQCMVDTGAATTVVGTSDGAASIAKASVVDGACSVLLVRSAGEAGEQTTFAALQVSYDGHLDASTGCTLAVTSSWGASTRVTLELSVQTATQACCPYGSCCATSETINQQQRFAFQSPTPVIAFAPGIDAGAIDSAVNGAMDLGSAPGLDANAIDADSIDSPLTN